MRPTHKREGNLFTQSTDLNVNLIQNTLTETSRIMFDYINIWAPCGPMKLTWKISNHPFLQHLKTVIIIPLDTQLFNLNIPDLQSFLIQLSLRCQCPGCAPVNHNAPCSPLSLIPTVHSPRRRVVSSPPFLQGWPDLTCHFGFILLKHSVEIIPGCAHKIKNLHKPPQATISLLVGCVC